MSGENALGVDSRPRLPHIARLYNICLEVFASLEGLKCFRLKYVSTSGKSAAPVPVFTIYPKLMLKGLDLLRRNEEWHLR